MVYVCVAIYVVLIGRLLFKHGKDIPMKKRKAVIIALLSELLVAIYQAIFPTSLISCLGITLQTLGYYLTVENPDALLVELLEEETKRADVANQAKTNFLANMSHEIRTPINAVLGMNEMILRECKERTIIEYAKDVQGAAKSLLSIINDILDISKIEAGKLTIMPVEYEFAGMIHDVRNMISFKAKAKELEFKVSIDEKIPRRLIGDDIRIRQILVNLLNNAVKYTHEGSIMLEARLVSDRCEKVAGIAFAVRDTGIGIKKEDIQKLYLPFERIEEKRNRNIEGTGLGMNITMQLLDMLDSRLEIVSEYGKGSSFSFVLNQQVVDSQPVGVFEERTEETGEYTYGTSFEAPDARVLVVDDSEMNRKVFCSLLKDTKIQIEEACSGRECIEKAKRIAFDIIFMDHMMPEMDGIETYRAMKAIGDYASKDASVVILTANAIVGAKEQYISEGFHAFMTKPIDSDKLEELVQELLDDSLIHYVKRRNETGEVKTTEGRISDRDELPMIDGLDWEYASAHFKDIESMMKFVKLFSDTIEYEAKELEALSANIHQDEGRKNYCIKVHSMKNSASNIGIIPLSGLAKVLEDAARKDECEILTMLTPVFLKRWREYQEHLRVITDTFDEGENETKNAAEHSEQIADIIHEIKVAAEDTDVDALDELLVRLEQYRFEGEQKMWFEKVKRAIIDLDVDTLGEI